MRYRTPKQRQQMQDRIVIAVAVVALALIFWGTNARADVITEFGVGYKDERFGATSPQLLPICEKVLLTGRQFHDPASPNWGRFSAGCGGDNPVFIGWPIAWQSQWKGPWMVRAGYFHMSAWFDGGYNPIPSLGDSHETRLDMAAATATFNWTRWNNSRRLRKIRSR